ncbi:MAG: YihY/virulence factor BrkB family protein [Acidimicrobiales bacterium]
MRMTERLDRYQRHHPWAGYPIAVIYKFFDDQGTYLAALITFYAFLSLFPLLLLLSSILGFVLQSSPHLQQVFLDSALSQFPIIGDELRDPKGLHGSGVAVAIGAVTAVYGALGVAQATQHAMNVAWAVPRNLRPNPLKARLRSLLLIATAGIPVLATTVLSALGSSARSFGADISGLVAVLATLASVIVNTVVFVLVFRVSTGDRLTIRQVAPGALAAAAAWQLLQLTGTAYVGHVFKGASNTYGVFALVLGLVAWLFLAAIALVVCVEINVVRAKRLYPRSLRTPFTDDVDLTRGDQRAYTDAAAAQRVKGFESVLVRFEHDGQNATARRRARSESTALQDDDVTP